jgi:hypothetical protein
MPLNRNARAGFRAPSEPIAPPTPGKRGPATAMGLGAAGLVPSRGARGLRAPKTAPRPASTDFGLPASP